MLSVLLQFTDSDYALVSSNSSFKQYLQRALPNTSFDTPEELQSEINRLTVEIQRIKAKVLGVDPPPEEEVSLFYTVFFIEIYYIYKSRSFADEEIIFSSPDTKKRTHNIGKIFLSSSFESNKIYTHYY